MKTKQQLIIIFGPEAVGKMSVGKYLKTNLGYQLFHDHLAIEFVRKFFELSSHNFWPLLSKIRRQIFIELSSSYNPGFVITTVWNFDESSDQEYIEGIINLFEENLWEVSFVELEACVGIRMQRNLNSDRIQEKPLLADKQNSESLLIEMEDLQLNTDSEFLFSQNYIKINNTELTIKETGDQIIKLFKLKNLPDNPDFM